MLKRILLLALVIAWPALSLAAPWAGPTNPPPSPNKEPPLNVDNQAQTKGGGLIVGSNLPFPTRADTLQNVYGVVSPGRVGGGALCILGDCKYSWSEVTSGSAITGVFGDGTYITGGGTTGNITLSLGRDRFWEPLVAGNSSDIKYSQGGAVVLGTLASVLAGVKLDVPGGIINSSGGFVLEARPRNPTSGLYPGRMWLCTSSNLAADCPTN